MFPGPGSGSRLAPEVMAANLFTDGEKLGAALMGHVRKSYPRIFAGLPIVIDRPKGTVQRGRGPDGAPWERTYTVDYGYIVRTEGGDREHADVFLGDNEKSQDTFWITQLKHDGTFDEFKVMVGFDSESDAKKVYLDHVPEELFGSMVTVPVQVVRALLGLPPQGTFFVTEKSSEGTPPAIFKTDGDHMARLLGVTKTAQQVLVGVVLEPDVVDGHGDTYSAEDIEKAAHFYLRHFGNVGLEHKRLINHKAVVVESYILLADLEIGGMNLKKGTWLMAIQVLDSELWGMVESGEIDGLSIGGLAAKLPLPQAA